ncbi:laminin subunit alpha-4-like isoform x3 [Plakobranchus ocellatus]|uniref:Laminin subunit alpha-4-like isoform x3 n=1 Tax=Plakobranchus ocellatus TaxID=259542 RepID=A0AAV4ACG4_9GAST|nr:laminin subunit alpha-4-like isoform x3 [Plakobranchus ocellatus]
MSCSLLAAPMLRHLAWRRKEYHKNCSTGLNVSNCFECSCNWSASESCDVHTGKCRCKPGFTGSRCHLDIDECTTSGANSYEAGPCQTLPTCLVPVSTKLSKHCCYCIAACNKAISLVKNFSNGKHHHHHHQVPCFTALAIMVLHFFLSFVASIASNDFPAFSQSVRPSMSINRLVSSGRGSHVPQVTENIGDD